MKTKIIYLVVGTENDIYISQTMIAAYTARKYNPSAEILLVVDKTTSDVIDKTIPKIKSIVTETVVVDCPCDLNKMQKSRYLKTTLRKNIKGDFLFIDSDTIVTCDLSEIDNINADIASVIDRHSLVENHIYKDTILRDIELVGLKISDLCNKYFNSGVLYVKDTPASHKLFECWYKYWDISRKMPNSRSTDQGPLAKANMECGYLIKELPGEWNCQLSDNFLNYLSDAKILHYFASNKKSPYKLYNKELFKQIMREGRLSDELKANLENPKRLFIERHSVLINDDTKILRTNIYAVFKWHKWLFNIFEYISKVCVTHKL